MLSARSAADFFATTRCASTSESFETSVLTKFPVATPLPASIDASIASALLISPERASTIFISTPKVDMYLIEANWPVLIDFRSVVLLVIDP